MAGTIRESTMSGYRGMAENCIKPYLRNKKIGSVTTADVQK